MFAGVMVQAVCAQVYLCQDNSLVRDVPKSLMRDPQTQHRCPLKLTNHLFFKVKAIEPQVHLLL